MSSSPKHIPEGYRTVSPYLTVQGAADLLDFVKQVFDAEELTRTDQPGRGIAHAAVRIGDSTVEMSDATEQWPATPSALHVYVPDTDAVYRRAIEAGAASLMEPTDHDYGERSAAVRDRSGNNWYIATTIESTVEAGSGGTASQQ
jgi:PhnB protein